MEKIKKFFFQNAGTKQTATKNTFWLILGEVLVRIFKMLLIVYVARKLGVEGWGIFSYAISIGSILMIFSDIGISGLITREMVQKKEEYSTFISTALFLKIIILLISTVLIVFLSPLISNIKEANILFPIIAIVLFFDSMRDLGFAINRASEKMEMETMVKTVMSIIILVLGIILLKIKLAPESMAIAYAVGSAIGFFAIAIVIRKDIKKFISRINPKIFKLIIKTTLPFTVITLMGSIMGNTDIFMLGIWRDSTEIGLYTSVQRIQQFIIIIPSMIATSVFPIMSRLANNNDKEKFKEILEKTISIIMIIGIPIATGGIILSKQLILLVFGSEYLAATPILCIFMLVLLVSFPLILLSNAVFAYNKQKGIAMAFLFGVITNVLLNLLLIPKFGAMGAIIATFISTTVIVFTIWKKMQKINNFEILSKLKKTIFSTIVMSLSILMLKYFDVNIILNIVISSLVYFSFLIILKETILKEARKIINI